MSNETDISKKLCLEESSTLGMIITTNPRPYSPRPTKNSMVTQREKSAPNHNVSLEICGSVMTPIMQAKKFSPPLIFSRNLS